MPVAIIRLLPASILLSVPVAHAAMIAMQPHQDDAYRIAAIVRQMDQPLARADGLPHTTLSSDGSWSVELGGQFLEGQRGPQIPAELDARLQAIRLEVLLQRERQGAPAQALEFRFDGHSLEAHYPERPRPATHLATEVTDVFVSASHGYYLHGKLGWQLQRPLCNGMVEDLVTPRFADRLVAALQGDGYQVALSRSRQQVLHPVAGQPWWQMAARYNAQALYPARPDIWQSYADRDTPLREYNDDIRTRPLMANEIGAGALVHLHTNAAASTEATGAMGFHQPGRSEDQRLGHVLLCAMRDAIQALPQYHDYRVRVQPMGGNYGENRLALAPSILLELGFHTNPQDAAALQDPAFQEAVAQGLRQGYAEFRQGAGAEGEPVCQ